MTTNTNDTSERSEMQSSASGTSDAVQIIKTMAAQGHALRYIAGALQLQKVPTPSGRGRWDRKTVSRIAVKHGVRVRWAR